jgi:hypothetical protein
MLIGDLTTALDVLIGLGLLGAVLYFVFLFSVAVTRRAAVQAGPRCERCEASLVPLLDASRRYHGEAACSRCGTLHEGVPWPAEGTWVVELDRRDEAPGRTVHS